MVRAQDWHKLAGSVRYTQPRGDDDSSQLEHPVEEDTVWGVAYRIDPEKEGEVRAYLGESSPPVARS